MKKIMFTLSVLFVVLTFVGAGYVLYNAGSVNAGYASGMISLPEGMLQEGNTENEETEGYEDEA